MDREPSTTRTRRAPAPTRPVTKPRAKAHLRDGNVTIWYAKTASGAASYPSKGTTAACLECGAPVIAKCGTHRRHHWAHQSRSACSGPSGVSMKHQAMVDAVVVGFAGSQATREFRIEIPGGTSRRADVYFVRRGQAFVVECQCSPITLEQMVARTKDWNDHGAAVLWVFDHRLLKVRGSSVTLPAWMQDWVVHRGWRQGYVMDDAGTLFWLRLHEDGAVTLRPITAELRPGPSRFAGVDRFADAQPKLICDRIPHNREVTLQVAAFAWATTTQEVLNPFGVLQPDWVSFKHRAAASPDLTVDACVTV